MTTCTGTHAQSTFYVRERTEQNLHHKSQKKKNLSQPCNHAPQNGTSKQRGGEKRVQCCHTRPTRNFLLGRLLIYGRVLANNLDGHRQVVLFVRTRQHLSIRARAQLGCDHVSALRILLVSVHGIANEPGKHAGLLLCGRADRIPGSNRQLATRTLLHWP